MLRPFRRTGPLPASLVLAVATLLLAAGPIAAQDETGAQLQVLPVSTQHWIGENDLILALFDAESAPVSSMDAPISLTLIDPRGVAREPVTPMLGRWAVTGRDLYVARVPFDQTGTWTADVSVEWGGETLEGASTIEVLPDDGTPALGAPAPAVDTPTLIDVFNLADAISSDPEQVAAFYVKSVEDEIRNNQPFVFVLDSYAFTPNEACGGALGILHDIFIEYPSLAVIHAEPWNMRFASGQLTLEPPEGPATLAPWSEAFGITTVPWVFVVAGDGTVRAKFTGIFGTDELRAAMSSVSQWHPLGAPASAAPVVVAG